MKETPKKKTVREDRAAKSRGSATAVTHEAIALRAFEIFMARGGEPGREQDDWLQAERELRRRAPQ